MPRKMPLDHDVFAAINDGILRIQAQGVPPRATSLTLDDEGAGRGSFRDVDA
jgi:hypothetical protein